MNIVNTYLENRILGTTPEQQAALLMEAGQLFISKSIKAIEDKRYFDMSTYLNRVVDIVREASVRLNYESGGELVENLNRIYDWWISDILTIAASRDVEKLKNISHYMKDIGLSWSELAKKQLNQKHTELNFVNRVI